MNKSAIPFNYKLTIKTILTNEYFDGSVFIMFKIQNDIHKILLNIHDLDILFVSCNNQAINFKTDNEYLHIYHDFRYGMTYTVGISYTGILNKQNNMTGFYISKSKDKLMGITQFEPTYARKVFPCIDDPEYKASYDITIIHEPQYTVLSNMPSKETTTLEDGMIMNSFNQTPIMPTYLVAFVIGEFGYIEHSVNNTLVRVYGIEELKDDLYFALSTACKCLDLCNEYFDYKYFLPKLDLIAVPDFSSGAMENWGLITFRDELLYVNGYTNQEEKEHVAITICHELAHQWFGNLVTMKNWNCLWLNESMATYYGWYFTDLIYPNWHIWDNYICDDYEQALNLDGMFSTHPIENNINNEHDIKHMFDAISYAKGSVIIRFVADYMKDKFRQGMRRYIKKYQFNNATSFDLWDMFDNVNGNKIVSTIMKSWIYKSGYPKLFVNTNDGTIKQIKNTHLKTKDDNTMWIFPLYVNNKHIIIEDKISKVEPQMAINMERMVLCRVLYTSVPKKVRVKEYINILSDYLYFFLSGHVTFTRMYEVICVIFNHNILQLCPNVWKMLYNGLKKIDDIAGNLLINDLYADIGICINKIKIGETNVRTHRLRNILYQMLDLVKDPCHHSHVLKKYKTNKCKINIDPHYSIVYKTVTRLYGDEKKKNYYDILDAFNTSTNISHRHQLMCGITQTSDIDCIKNNISMIDGFMYNKKELNTLNIKDQDIMGFVRQMMSNKNARSMIRNYLLDNFDYLETRYKIGANEHTHLIKIVCMYVYDNVTCEKVKSVILKNNRFDDMIIKQSIENMNIGIAYRKNIDIIC